MNKVLGAIQPAYLAWVPFFERMSISDVFIYLDDVEYSKNSFHNRNSIKTSQGPLTLTVPVLYKGNSKAFISTININYTDRWNIKHWKSIESNYNRAKYFDEVAFLINPILMKNWESLADLNIALIEMFRTYLGISTPCYRSSEIKVKGTANDKLVGLCHQFDADGFIVKPNTDHYHPRSYFKEKGIDFKYFSPNNNHYQQLFGDFCSGLSILDYAMNCGRNSFSKL